MKIIRWIYSCCLIVLMAACTSENGLSDATAGVSFEISTEGFDGELTRSSETPREFDNIYFYLFREGKIDNNANCYYIPLTSSIKAEGLQDGNYHMVVLGIHGNSSQDGVTVRTLTSADDTWLQFPAEQNQPLSADYLYGNLDFKVEGGKLSITAPKIILKHIVGKIEFHTIYPNQYTEASTQQLTYSLQASCYTEFKANNSFSGEGTTTITDCSLEHNKSFYFSPIKAAGGKMKGGICLHTLNHRKETYASSYEFEVEVASNKASTVNVSLTNPDDSEGMIYASNRTITSDNFYKILQDSEPQSVYYDINQRSFYINQPIQVSIDEQKQMLNIRSYCILPLTNITIYAKFPGTNNQWVRFAYVDKIEGFGNLCYPIPCVGKSLSYTDKGGRNYIVALTSGDLKKSNFQFEITSQDAVYAKYTQMIPKWRLYFASYGGNPDQENGRPSGNWIGIRPVHIREAIAWFTNLAYMCSFKDYEEAVVGYSGTLVDNNNNPIVGDNRMSIVRALRSCSSFKIGLINGDGTGVGGLGGGEVFGVYQEAYLTHYNSQMHSIKMYHELGHCMGYNHTSSMTYGDWARYIMPYFYFGHLSNAIVTSREVLKSYANPTLYRFH